MLVAVVGLDVHSIDIPVDRTQFIYSPYLERCGGSTI